MDDLSAALDILVQEGPARGLILSTANTVRAPASPKSTIWCPNLPDQVGDPSQRGLKRVVGEGIVLLGAPLGSAAFVASQVKKKVAKIEEVTDAEENRETDGMPKSGETAVRPKQRLEAIRKEKAR